MGWGLVARLEKRGRVRFFVSPAQGGGAKEIPEKSFRSSAVVSIVISLALPRNERTVRFFSLPIASKSPMSSSGGTRVWRIERIHWRGKRE